MRLPVEQISQDEAQSQLISDGIYGPWYLRPSQLDIYELIVKEKNPFIECSRRFGKTTSILTFVLEQLNDNPGWICRWCVPWQKQARLIVKPIISKLQARTPKSQRLKWQSTDTCFVHPNGSMLYLIGVNDDSGESARGPASNIIVADEYGTWKNASYVITDILRPQLQDQEGRWLIRASTPPKDLGHIYYTDKERAMRLNRYVMKTIFDKESLSKEELDEIIEETGGVHTTSFRREYMCEEVSDETMLIIPEFRDTQVGEGNIVPDDYPRPEFYTSYIGGDSGADDNTAVLFGYYDFIKNEIVIEDEIITAGKTTEEIVNLAKAKELELWVRAIDPDGKPVINYPHIRAYDAPKQLIYDIFVTHKWPVRMPDKADKHAAIHSLRVEVGARRIKIKEKCKHLRRQLRVGIWKNEQHLDFQRNEGLGHLDAIAALIYFNRSVDKKINPIPPYLGLTHETHILPELFLSAGSPEAEIATALGFRGK